MFAKVLLVTVLAFFTFIDSAIAETLGWPTDSRRITSPYGIRNVEGNPAASRNHQGTDIGALSPGVAGDEVRATHSGTVITARSLTVVGSGYGNYIQIQSEDGLISSLYGHLQSLAVSAGQTVSKGQRIGTMGGARNTIGAGNSGGVHLHYEVVVRRNGESYKVDPELTEGQDLSDPATAGSVIASSGSPTSPVVGLGTVGGGTVGGGMIGGGSASGSGQSCSAEILDTGKQLKEANMAIEKNIIDQMVQKPMSVMEGSCFDQFGEMFNQEIGKIFSDQTQGLEAFNFGGIFQDVQGKLMGELQGALFGDRAKSMGASISSKLSGAFSSIFGSGNVEYGCAVMNTLWEIMQCEGILDFDIPSLGEAISGKLNGLIDKIMPSSCTGKALFSGAMGVADKAFEDFGGNLPDQLKPSNLESIINGN